MLTNVVKMIYQDLGIGSPRRTGLVFRMEPVDRDRARYEMGFSQRVICC